MGTYSDLMKSKPSVSPEPNAQAENASSLGTEDSDPVKVFPSTETERFSERKTERPELRSSTLPYKRRTKRYSFEFYDDQILAIKRLVYEANLSGENISQSDIVRTAVDEYLQKEGR